jgi:hypothetical protein
MDQINDENVEELEDDGGVVDDQNVHTNIDELRKILSYLSKGYKVPKIVYDTIFEIAVREIEEKKRVVLIKRDPNVHKGRIQSVYVKIIDGETINVHPGIVNGFGADFDGDSVYCNIKVYKPNENGEMVGETVHISRFTSLVNKAIIKSIKTREDGILVYDYDILDDIYVKAIDMKTGNVDYKKVTSWSIHSNVKLYEISSDIHELDETKLLVSSDHSMVAYDNATDEFVRISPVKLKEEPKRYYLIKSGGVRGK